MTAVSIYSPINEMLPTEILGLVFEEHTLLQWNAPAVDGLVCRLWRQIILDTPRAWSHITIRRWCAQPSVEALRLWMNRSRSSPLHLQSDRGGEQLQRLVAQYHTSISSLRWIHADVEIFEDLSFPNLRSLHIVVSREGSSKLGTMERLDHLHLGSTRSNIVDIERVPPLKSLSAHYSCPSRLLQHSQATLTRLILKGMHIHIPNALDLPNLCFLSVFKVIGIQSLFNAPKLEVFHEGGIKIGQLFSTPMTSVVEYGVYETNRSFKVDVATMYPNLRFLSLRLLSPHVVGYLKSFDSQEFENGDRLSRLELVEFGYPGTRSSKFTAQEIKSLQERMVQIMEKRERGSGLKLQMSFGYGGPFKLPLECAEVRLFYY
jgi:hypothetical protein